MYCKSIRTIKKIFILYLSILLIAGCSSKENTSSANPSKQGDTGKSTGGSQNRPGEIVKAYGITADSIAKLAKYGVRPATLEEQKISDEKIYLDDWLIRTDADFKKTIHIFIHSGEKAKKVVAVRFRVVGDSCNFSATFKRKIELMAGGKITIKYKLGNVECNGIEVNQMDYVLADGTLGRSKVPLPIERIINK